MFVLLAILIGIFVVSGAITLYMKIVDDGHDVFKEPSGVVFVETRIDPATVAAYEKLGVVPGLWWAGDGGFHWSTDSDSLGYRFGGFEFREFPKGKLPDVPVDFGLYLGKCKVTGADMRGLAHLHRLMILELDRSQITDATLRALCEVGLLHTLAHATGSEDYRRPNSAGEVRGFWLRGTPVSDAGLKELAPLRNLTRLALSEAITDAGMRELASFKELADLGLGGTSVTDEGLKELAPLKRLTRSDLGPKITDAGLKELQPFKNLSYLGLVESNLTGAGFQASGPSERAQGYLACQ